jgi:hypothetical protein
MTALRNAAVSVNAVKKDLAQMFGTVFALEWSIVDENPDQHFTATGKIARMHTSIM